MIRWKTLVVVPHMDDEAISCGGLIQNRLKKSSSRVHVVVVCDRKYPGIESNPDTYSVVQAQQYEDFKKSLKVLAEEAPGFISHSSYLQEEGEPYKAGYYDWLDIVEGELRTPGGYDEVVIPAPLDLNQDHRHLYDVCRIALRPANLGPVKRILMWHAMDGVLNASPNWFEPLNLFDLEQKKKAIACYSTEMRYGPHPRSLSNIEAQARVWGSACGYDFAEPFSLLLNR